MSALTEIQSQNSRENIAWWLIFSAWLVAAISTLGSLFFSEIMELVPCVLCWYQRIFMFPLAIVLLMGLFPLDRKVVNYALPLAAIGLLFTIYHCLLYWGFIPENLQPCSKGVSCADDSMVLFEVLPIPILSLISFIMIIILLLKARTLK